jgi:hypothetical protein
MSEAIQNPSNKMKPKRTYDVQHTVAFMLLSFTVRAYLRFVTEDQRPLTKDHVELLTIFPHL